MACFPPAQFDFARLHILREQRQERHTGKLSRFADPLVQNTLGLGGIELPLRSVARGNEFFESVNRRNVDKIGELRFQFEENTAIGKLSFFDDDGWEMSLRV
ncbi:MAG TPA: hypothetical protein VKU82_04625 [Planctomycetaceae bacterium]|nr:hypothetical protein [Planctomycetaceae bacterium]